MAQSCGFLLMIRGGHVLHNDTSRTLDDHRAERGEFVRQLLDAAGIQPAHGPQDGPYQWERPAPTDDRIRDLVLTALDSPELVARLRHRDQPEPDLHARIRADEDELELWAADQGNGMVSRVEWRKATTPIRARLEAARAQLATSTQTTALVGFVGALEDMTHRWDAANNSQRRAVIHAVVETVTVHPAAVAGRNRFDTARLEPVWRV